MKSKVPFNVHDFVFTEVEDVDFDELEDEHLFALIAEYGDVDWLLASLALSNLVARARSNEALKVRAVAVVAAIVRDNKVRDNKVDSDFFASALSDLYLLDRHQGLAEILRVIDSCDMYAAEQAANRLGYDIELYKGEPAFDAAVVKLAERLRKECQNDHALRDDEIFFLQNAGYPVIPVSDRDDQGRDVGVFRAHHVRGDFVDSVIARVSSGTEVIRVTLRNDDAHLVACYEIVEFGISHARALQLIHQQVLVELYQDQFRGRAWNVSYHDVLKGTAVACPYSSP